MTDFYTSDLHFGHPFVAALRGYAKPGWPGDATIREVCEREHVDLWDVVDWERHDRDLLDAINSVCGQEDTLTILGDLSSGSSRSARIAETMLNELKVPRKNRRLILGNHENALIRTDRKDMTRWAGLFCVVAPVGLEVLPDGRPVLLSHFPYRDMFDHPAPKNVAPNTIDERLRRFAPPRIPGLALLHGHTHADHHREFPDPMMVNVGVDAWGMRPVSADTLASILRNT